MSSGFNFGQPSTGFTFGAQKTTPAGSGGGFTFGSPTQANSNSTAAFSFGTAKSTADGKGFSFGTPTTTFGLGTAPQTTTAAGLTFGSTVAPAAASGFTLGKGLSTLTTTASPGGGSFTFGNSTQTSTNSTGTFSLSTSTKNRAASRRFSFGTPATTFGLGTAPQTTTAAGLTFGSTAAPAAGSGFTLGKGFNFVSPTQANSNSTGTLSFGTPVKNRADSKGFSFGTPTTTFGLGSTPQTTTATGLTFGSMAAPPIGSRFTLGGGLCTKTTTASPGGGGFSFGISTQASSNSTSSFSFGTPMNSIAAGKGFSFGAPTTSFGLGSTPQATTAAGLTFGSVAAPPAGSGFTLGGGVCTKTTAATPAGRGFTFGLSTLTSTNSTSTFSFGTPAKSTAAGGGFSFGTPTTTFGLGTTPQTTAAKTRNDQSRKAGVPHIYKKKKKHLAIFLKEY